MGGHTVGAGRGAAARGPPPRTARGGRVPLRGQLTGDPGPKEAASRGGGSKGRSSSARHLRHENPRGRLSCQPGTADSHTALSRGTCRRRGSEAATHYGCSGAGPGVRFRRHGGDGGPGEEGVRPYAGPRSDPDPGPGTARGAVAGSASWSCLPTPLAIADDGGGPSPHPHPSFRPRIAAPRTLGRSPPSVSPNPPTCRTGTRASSAPASQPNLLTSPAQTS